MRYMLLSFGLTAALCTTAQDWCAPGATWRYSEVAWHYSSTFERTCLGDTIIDGFEAHRTRTRRVGVWNAEPFDETSDGVSFVSPDLLRYVSSSQPSVHWDTLAWFGAVPGDRWSFLIDDLPWARVDVSVSDTGLLDFGTVQLRFLVVEYGSSLGFGPTHDTIVERIGPLLIDPENVGNSFGMETPAPTLLCYGDDEASSTHEGSTIAACSQGLSTPSTARSALT